MVYTNQKILEPWLLAGSCSKSIEMTSQGLSGGGYSNTGAGLVTVLLFFAHLTHLETRESISTRIVGQQKLL